MCRSKLPYAWRPTQPNTPLCLCAGAEPCLPNSQAGGPGDLQSGGRLQSTHLRTANRCVALSWEGVCSGACLWYGGPWPIGMAYRHGSTLEEGGTRVAGQLQPTLPSLVGLCWHQLDVHTGCAWGVPPGVGVRASAAPPGVTVQRRPR